MLGWAVACVQAPSTLNFLRMQLDAALDGMYWWLGTR